MFDLPQQDTPFALLQHAAFANALAACGARPQTLDLPHPALVLQRRIAGVLPLAMLARVTLAPADFAALPDALRAAGLARRLLIISPDHPAPWLGETGAVALMTPATTAELRLDQSPDAMRRAMHQKWRNRLRHGEAAGIRVVRTPLPDRADHPLLVADAQQQRERGFRNWPAVLTLAYARANPKSAMLFTALSGSDSVAQMLFLRHGSGATYHIGHITDRGKTLSAHNLVLWRAMTWLAKNGHTRLDLGTLDTANNPGLAHFKLGSGARPRQLGGTWGWWPPLGRSLRHLAALDRKNMCLRPLDSTPTP